ncbi:hypothetical protein SLS63_012210 [Diaporthe eres]|uniref:DUF7029 domain-containing protein n=1 Tax=Diaporthe eres TaxID=83184 RepID=A0ABR1NRY8_DIAER
MLYKFFLLVVATHGVLGDKRCIVNDGESEEDPFLGTYLLPAAHWDVDQTCVDNLIPIKAEDPCPMYYGVDDPCEEGYFGFLTYYFSSPVVVLDHSSFVAAEYTTQGSLKVEFSSSEAFAKASATWSVDGGLILAANGEGCATSKNDRCYYNCQGLVIDEINQVIVASGWAQDPESLAIQGEAEWGYWKPQADNPFCSPGGSAPGGGSGQTGSTVGSGSGPGGSDTDSGNPNPNPNPTTPSVPEESNIFGVRPRCRAPVDTTYGLPTACLGEYFDVDLDDQQGYIDVNSNPVFQAFLAALDPEETQDGQLTRKASHLRRGGLRDFGNALVPGFGDLLEGGKDLVKPVFDKVIEWTTIKGSFDQNLRFQIPDPSSKNADAKTPKDKSITETKSPWGKALRLKRFKNEPEYGESGGKSGYLDVFCVGCGVKGNRGKVDLTAFLDIILQIGIDGKTTGKQTSKSTIFEQGLPGLSFGTVSIGPRISLGYRTTIKAAVKGRALAGAMMGIKKGLITLDFVSPGKSKSSGWTPKFDPVFKASGTVKVSAELGLPVSLQCGLKIARLLDKSVGITDDPSIKATLETSASIDEGTDSVFKETKGCKGISTLVTWRNQIKYNIFDGKDKLILDTGDRRRPAAPEPNIDTLGDQTRVTPEIGGSIPENQNVTDPSLAGQSASSFKRQDEGGEDDPELIDVTDSVLGDSTVSYPFQEVPSVAYNTTDGYQFVPLVDPTASVALVACSDANVYAVNYASEDLEFCSKTWSVYQDLLVGDAAGRILHFYRNTMSRVGVSRLRVSDGRDFPKEAVPVVFARPEAGSSGNANGGSRSPPAQNSTAPAAGGNSTAAAGAEDGSRFFVAADPDLNFYYPVVCTYTTNTPPRLFVVADPVSGVSMLQSSDIVYSITGGFVDTCALMPIVQGKYTGEVENEFGEYDDEIDA